MGQDIGMFNFPKVNQKTLNNSKNWRFLIVLISNLFAQIVNVWPTFPWKWIVVNSKLGVQMTMETIWDSKVWMFLVEIFVKKMMSMFHKVPKGERINKIWIFGSVIFFSSLWVFSKREVGVICPFHIFSWKRFFFVLNAGNWSHFAGHCRVDFPKLWFWHFFFDPSDRRRHAYRTSLATFRYLSSYHNKTHLHVQIWIIPCYYSLSPKVNSFWNWEFYSQKFHDLRNFTQESLVFFSILRAHPFFVLWATRENHPNVSRNRKG